MNTQPSPARAVAVMLLLVVLIPLLPLLVSRSWDWWEAWAYAAISIVGFAASRVLAGRRNPGLLAERARFLRHEDAKHWDKALAPLLAVGSGLVPFVAGLDALDGRSPQFSLLAKTLSLALILAGYAFASWALIENRYFSGVVRIQTDRDHRVVSSGPYRWVRHPGYAGGLAAYLGTPFFLDSPWAFLPAVFLMIVLVIRTALEDRTLREELAGYKEYATRTRYRLLPGVW